MANDRKSEIADSDTSEPTPQSMLTVTEVAKRWGVKPSKVSWLAACGKLPAINVATRARLFSKARYRIPLDAVIAFEQEERVKRASKEDVPTATPPQSCVTPPPPVKKSAVPVKTDRVVREAKDEECITPPCTTSSIPLTKCPILARVFDRATEKFLEPMLTPPELAKHLGVDASTVIGWIRSGELQAIDVARRGSRRPRFRISQEAIAAFERARTVIPPPRLPRRRRGEQTLRYF